MTLQLEVPFGSDPGRADWLLETEEQRAIRILIEVSLELSYMMKNHMNPGGLAGDTAIERAWTRITSAELRDQLESYKTWYSGLLEPQQGKEIKADWNSFSATLTPEQITRRWSSKVPWRLHEEFALNEARKGRESDSNVVRRAKRRINSESYDPAALKEYLKIRAFSACHAEHRSVGVSPDPIRMYVPEESLAAAQEWAEGAWVTHGTAVAAGLIVPNTLAAQRAAAAARAPGAAAVPAAAPAQGRHR
ncbi:hypothetical protein OG215_40855 (plasmid) [Streptomyces globisporus]|uniref:hypothetical protein n=1 Tax=Streptomyces globisporus TaxID=1908 RepID=UPI002F9113B2|nr:hypothetical protein OG215_40855 [Streptomyces globisporus]